jgi:hypothetical protein
MILLLGFELNAVIHMLKTKQITAEMHPELFSKEDLISQ